MAVGCFRRSRDFCCWYITGLSIKVTFTNTAFITLGSKCYYRKDLYYAWFKNLITDRDFYYACMGQNVITKETFITLGSSYYTCAFYTGKIGSLEMEMSQ